MQDIADKLGISKATVSLVLSGKAGSRVSEKTKARVIETARELDYHPNDLARSLRTGRTNVIGVLVTDISNEFFGVMAFHIQEEAKKRGYSVFIANTNESDDEMGILLAMMAGKKVDGVIAVPTQNCAGAFRDLMSKGIHLVQIDRYVEDVDADYVGTCNYESTRNAIIELIASGKKKVGMVSLDLDVNAINERRAGFRDPLRERGLYEPELEQTVPFESLPLIEHALLEISKHSPDALFFSSRRVFMQAMEVIAAQRDLFGPDTVILCFDKAKPFKNLIGYELWYIEQPVEKMAKKAFGLLMEDIDGNTIHGRHTFLSALVK